MSDTHAYLILAHVNPGQIRKLLGVLDDERNEIYIHIDKKAPFGYEVLKDCCKHSSLHFIEPRLALSWGGVSIIRAEMALLEEAVKKEHSYYHLISGMDLPVKTQDHIHSFFIENAGKEFLNIWQLPDHTLRRVRYYTLFPEGNHFFLTNLLNHAFKGILRMLHISRNRDIEFKQGSQWFSITHGLASYIVSQRELVERVFNRSCICDEIFIPTLVWRSQYKDRLYCNDETAGHDINQSNMRFIDWSRGKSIRHPWVFTVDDYDLLMSVPHLWARKFDERTDSVIIDKICGFVRPET